MTFYENLVMQTQQNYSMYYQIYQQGGSPYKMSTRKKPSWDEQIEAFADAVRNADSILVGGASGLSAAGGGDFYYGDTPSFRKYFGRFAEKFGIKGAFNGTFRHWDTPNEKWAFMATFLHTTQNAPLREPYKNLDAILKDKDFFVLTTNQDTQFMRLYPESKVAEIQGDHRFLQCSRCCTDDVWDAIEPVNKMIEALGDDKTAVPDELIPRCPHCGAEAFPWVRGYGNFLEGRKYQEQYQKVSYWIKGHAGKKILFLELGVGRLTPMFIQEPFWNLTLALPHAHYVAVNKQYDFLPEQIEEKGQVIVGDIAQVLREVRDKLGNSVNKTSDKEDAA